MPKTPRLSTLPDPAQLVKWPYPIPGGIRFKLNKGYYLHSPIDVSPSDSTYWTGVLYAQLAQLPISLFRTSQPLTDQLAQHPGVLKPLPGPIMEDSLLFIQTFVGLCFTSVLREATQLPLEPYKPEDPEFPALAVHLQHEHEHTPLFSLALPAFSVFTPARPQTGLIVAFPDHSQPMLDLPWPDLPPQASCDAALTALAQHVAPTILQAYEQAILHQMTC